MSNARNNILQRLRRTQPAFEETNDSISIVFPTYSQEKRIERFKSTLETVRTEVHVIPTDTWLDSFKQLVLDKGLNNLLYAEESPLGKKVESAWSDDALPQLTSLKESIEQWKEKIFFNIDASVTAARAGIAETGSLVLWPDESEPRSWSLVPPVHFIVLEASDLYDNFADLVEKEKWNQGMPTNAVLISGPSKSADIEQTLAYGVHGPTELIVLLLT